MAVLKKTQEREFDRDWRNFILAMVAANPRDARKILPLLDRQTREPGEFAEPITDEELQDYVPVQQRGGLGDVLKDLQTFGFSLVED